MNCVEGRVGVLSRQPFQALDPCDQASTLGETGLLVGYWRLLLGPCLVGLASQCQAAWEGSRLVPAV